MIKLYTSYFAKVNKLPSDIIPIAICGSVPKGWDGLWIKYLAPKWWFFSKWKETHDNNFYIENFYKEVLVELNPQDVVQKLLELSNGKTPCLVCYEKPSDFCHRHLVADWLNEKLKDKIIVQEFNYDEKN